MCVLGKSYTVMCERVPVSMLGGEQELVERSAWGMGKGDPGSSWFSGCKRHEGYSF